jgi:hypothetical protein
LRGRAQVLQVFGTERVERESVIAPKRRAKREHAFSSRGRRVGDQAVDEIERLRDTERSRSAAVCGLGQGDYEESDALPVEDDRGESRRRSNE